MNLLHFVKAIDYNKWLLSRVCQNEESILSTRVLLKQEFELFVSLL